MRPRQCGKVWLDKDMPGSSHSVTSWFGVPEEGQSQDIAPYHRGLQRKWEYCTCAQERGKWPGIASTKTNNGFGIWRHCSPCVLLTAPGQDGWTEKGTKRLYSRTETTGLLHSSSLQHNFYNNLNKPSSLLMPSNQTFCGIKRLKTSYFVMPKLLKGTSTQECRSPEEHNVDSRTDTEGSHDSAGEPVPGSEQIQTELMTQRQICQSHGRLSLKAVPTFQTA